MACGASGGGLLGLRTTAGQLLPNPSATLAELQPRRHAVRERPTAGSFVAIRNIADRPSSLDDGIVSRPLLADGGTGCFDTTSERGGMLPDGPRHERIRRSLALALNHEWPQLERTRKYVAKLPLVDILDGPTVQHMPIVATVATDGGEGRLNLAPISIQIVRVADNRGVVHFEEFVPQSLRPDEVMKFFFASDERFQRILRYLGITWQDLLPDSDFQRSHLLGMLRELLEWAALLKLAGAGMPTLLLHDGLLRSVMLRDSAFQALRHRFEELTTKHNHLLVGVAKRSSVVNYLSVAFGVNETFESAAPAYIRIPADLERETAPAQYRWIGERAMGQLHLAKLDVGADVPVLPVDVASWQHDQVDAVMRCLHQSARASFPRRGYPQELMMAHEHAKLSALEIEMLESELLQELVARDPAVARQASALMLLGQQIVEDLDEA